MGWYLSKIVFRIMCGKGDHTAQFDEQLRLIEADSEDEAFTKAYSIGINEQETFYNVKQQLVQWKFENVLELYLLSALIDGAELYSSIKEVEDGDAYSKYVHLKAASILQKETHKLLHLI